MAAPPVPLPVERGEGAEDRRSEAGEGLLHASRKPLTRLAALPLATLSPLRGEREKKTQLPASASGKNMSRQSAGGFFSVPTLLMKLTNEPMPPSLVL